jgi:hypothetical protein
MMSAGHEAGLHFPEAKFDNNTSSLALFFGWFPSVLVLCVYFLGRRSTLARQATQTKRAEDSTQHS